MGRGRGETFPTGEVFPGPNPRPPGGGHGPSKRFARPTTLTAKSGARILNTGIGAIWLDESPQYMIEGETTPFVITYRGVTTVSSPTNTLYLDGSDVSSTSLSGSTTASGNVVATRSITAVAGPNRYILAVAATADAQTQINKLLVIVGDPADESGGTGWVQEGPQWAVEGESLTLSITLQGAMSISGTPTAKAYKDGTDVTSTNLTGACSVSGLTITLPVLAAITGGRYVLAVTASVDGRTEIKKILLFAQNAEDEL